MSVAGQASLSMEFPTQEYWSGLPFPTPGGSSPPRDRAHVFYVSCISGGFFTHWAISFFHLWLLSCTNRCACWHLSSLYMLPARPFDLGSAISSICPMPWNCLYSVQGDLTLFSWAFNDISHCNCPFLMSSNTPEHRNTPLVVKLCLWSSGLYSLH